VIANLAVNSEAGLAAAGNQIENITGSLIFFSLFFMAIGLISIVYPRLFWYLRIGRKVKGVEPSSVYLWVLRFGGLMLFALSAIILYYFVLN